MRVGSAEVGGLIEIVECDPAARPGLDVDHRHRPARPLAPARESRDGRTRVELRLAYGVAGAGHLRLDRRARRRADGPRQPARARCSSSSARSSTSSCARPPPPAAPRARAELRREPATPGTAVQRATVRAVGVHASVAGRRLRPARASRSPTSIRTLTVSYGARSAACRARQDGARCAADGRRGACRALRGAGLAAATRSSLVSGLYHFALPGRDAPTSPRFLVHAARDQVPLTGMSDHYVSEAIYLLRPRRARHRGLLGPPAGALGGPGRRALDDAGARHARPDLGDCEDPRRRLRGAARRGRRWATCTCASPTCPRASASTATCSGSG